jgi:hypothetical protein
MLRDDTGNGDGRRSAPRNVLGEPLEICSIKPPRIVVARFGDLAPCECRVKHTEKGENWRARRDSNS